jgi:hypothetical protein
MKLAREIFWFLIILVIATCVSFLIPPADIGVSYLPGTH